VLVVEHDMRLVMGLADHVVVMDHGEMIAQGPPDLVRDDPAVIAAYLGQEVRARAA
jgi:branched-chain amino acid transport system ATP-binding protein